MENGPVQGQAERATPRAVVMDPPSTSAVKADETERATVDAQGSGLSESAMRERIGALDAAYATVGVTALYNALLPFCIARYPVWFGSGYVTTIVDSAVTSCVLIATGNGSSSSPYAPSAFAIIISVAMRYGYVLSALAA